MNNTSLMCLKGRGGGWVWGGGLLDQSTIISSEYGNWPTSYACSLPMVRGWDSGFVWKGVDQSTVRSSEYRNRPYHACIVCPHWGDEVVGVFGRGPTKALLKVLNTQTDLLQFTGGEGKKQCIQMVVDSEYDIHILVTQLGTSIKLHLSQQNIIFILS
jgi:hypothetical protein